MLTPADVASHYTRGCLTGAITSGLAALGKAPQTVTVDDLAPVDEFHIGGRTATKEFIDQLALSAEMQVLDIGCGLGGPARFVASRHGCKVAGLDLTAEYVETGNALCAWVGLSRLVSLQQGSALAVPFADGTFDAAYMLHVGMNIGDKEKLAREVARILRPSSVFGIYDIMQIAPGPLIYPVPWASSSDMSALAEPDRYKKALQAAGFVIAAERDRREFALAFYAGMRATSGALPPLGLHLLMGTDIAEKLKNMIAGIAHGYIAPVELIARKT